MHVDQGVPVPRFAVARPLPLNLSRLAGCSTSSWCLCYYYVCVPFLPPSFFFRFLVRGISLSFLLYSVVYSLFNVYIIFFFFFSLFFPFFSPSSLFLSVIDPFPAFPPGVALFPSPSLCPLRGLFDLLLRPTRVAPLPTPTSLHLL